MSIVDQLVCFDRRLSGLKAESREFRSLRVTFTAVGWPPLVCASQVLLRTFVTCWGLQSEFGWCVCGDGWLCVWLLLNVNCLLVITLWAIWAGPRPTKATGSVIIVVTKESILDNKAIHWNINAISSIMITLSKIYQNWGYRFPMKCFVQDYLLSYCDCHTYVALVGWVPGTRMT